MLKDAIESGKFPEKKNAEKQSGNKTSFKENEKKSKEKDRKYNKKNNISVNSVQNFIHLYKVFNLQPGCTSDELKDSYRKLLKKYHPDNFNGFPETQKLAERKTQELISAFKKLLELIG